jgi:DNA-binding response OmpR family regulator
MSDEALTLLIADDEVDIHRIIQAALEGRDYRVLDAYDGDEALEKAIVEKPDMVVLDVMMPGLNGWELARYFRSKPEFKRMGILILTGIGETLNELTSPLYGADAYLDKPFEIDALLDSVDQVIAAVKKRDEEGQADAEEPE